MKAATIRAFSLAGAALILIQSVPSSIYTVAEAQTSQQPLGAAPSVQPVKKAPKPRKAQVQPKSAVQTTAPVATEPATAAPNSAGAQTTTVETTQFASWAVSCDIQNSAPDKRHCVARTTIVRSNDDPRPIILLGVTKDAGAQRFFLQTPTTTQVKPGTQLTIGKNSSRHLEYVSCEPTLCTAEAPFDTALADELKGSDTATVTWSSLNAGDVRVDFRLDGAAAAIAFLASR